MPKTKNVITTAKMVEMIVEHKGTEFATIEVLTDAKLKKTGNPFEGTVMKRSKMNVCIGFNYENSVNNQRSREEVEEEFKSQPRRWGTRIDLKTVAHNGNVYLTVKSEKCLSTSFELDGTIISEGKIKHLLPKKYVSKTQGVDKEVVYRDINVENILAINFRGEEYIIL